MTKRLTKLSLDEVSLVPDPANPGARVLLVKRAPSTLAALVRKALGAERVTLTVASQGDPRDMNPTQILEAVEKALAPVVATVEALAARVAKAEMSEEDRKTYDAMSADDKAAFDKADDKERAAMLADARAMNKSEDGDQDDMTGDNDPEEKDPPMTEDQLKKAAQAVIEKAVKEATAPLQAEIENLRKANERAELLKAHGAAIAASGLDQADALDLLQKSAAEDRARILKSWDKLAAAESAILTPVGKSGSAPSNAEAQLDALAKARASEKGESFAVAYDNVLKSAEGAALYAKIGQH